jgi:hypothetical protein
MDLYIYFFFGPASVGGCASPYFLENTVAIQKVVKDVECTNHDDLRKRNDKETLEKMQAKKGRKLLKDNVDEMEECGPTTSFGEAYSKQLELEEVCVETERSREQRENTQYLMTMLEGLIAKATTPQEKSEYEAELVLLMRQTVAQGKLKSHGVVVHGVVVLQEPLEELVAEVHQHGFRNLEAGLQRRVWLPGS